MNYYKEEGENFAGDYQVLNDVSRETATKDLKQLIERRLKIPGVQKGAGAYYTPK